MEKDTSRKPILEKMRQTVEERLAPLLTIDPAKPLNPQQLEAVNNVIEDARTLLQCLEQSDDNFQSLCDQSLPGRTLLELLRNNSDKDPSLIWNSFVLSETEHLSFKATRR
jgi:hypothetical protein